MPQLQLDLEASAAARERGLKATTTANMRWIARMLEHLAAFARAKAEFTMEQFRAYAIEAGLEQPGSPNTWGALTQTAASRRVIVFTERYTPATSRKTHAHPVKVWRAPGGHSTAGDVS